MAEPQFRIEDIAYGMTNILVIHSPNQNCNYLFRQLDKLEVDYWVTTEQSALSEQIKHHSISLLICAVDNNTPPEKLAYSFTQLHIPILFIGSDNTVLEEHLKLNDDLLIDFLADPFGTSLLRHKLTFLFSISSHLFDLVSSHNEITRLRNKISDLHRSVDGHNSFLDLMSRRDGLTGLFNRRHFNSVIKEAYSECSTGSGDVSLIILNVDYFSEINKSCSQDFGDFVLNELSARITSNSSENDICFRLSGEEFAIIMLSTSLSEARKKAEAFRVMCEAKNFDNGNYIRNVTISIGIASYRAHSPSSHDEFIVMADQALFLAKSEGRNRIMSHTPIDRSSFGTTEQNFKILKESINRILDKTKTSTIRSLQLLTQGVMDNKESEQVQHAQIYAQLLSHQMGLPPTLIDTFRNSIILFSSIRYLLHNEMINKNGTLSTNEWDILADFPYKLGQITNLFDYFSGERTILLHHGERYDGNGYPEGLKGDEIPIGARIFSLVSAVAAMSSDRPYRKRLSPEAIIEELARNAGKQFDPNLVLQLIDVIEKDGILGVAKNTLHTARDSIRKKLS